MAVAVQLLPEAEQEIVRRAANQIVRWQRWKNRTDRMQTGRPKAKGDKIAKRFPEPTADQVLEHFLFGGKGMPDDRALDHRHIKTWVALASAAIELAQELGVRF
jgi:hypothetical protein